MITFVILEQENMEMAIDRPIPLQQAIDILDKKNKLSKESNLSMYCSYQLIYDDNMIYESSISLPSENFNLFQSIEQDMLEVNNGMLNEETEDFLHFLVKIFPKNVTKFTNSGTMESESKQVIEKSKKEKPKKIKKERQPINKKVVVKIFVSIALLFVVGFGVVYGVQNFSRAEKPKEETYESLLQEKKYLEAGKQFPEKLKDIEAILYEQAITTKKQGSLDTLKEFNASYPTTLGTFDIAIVTTDYKQAIDIYEKNTNDFTTEQERLTLVGYCYLKENDLEKAKLISKEISSVELEKKIFEYSQLTIEIEELEKELTELEKGGSKNKAKAQEIAEKKFNLMEKRLNL